MSRQSEGGDEPRKKKRLPSRGHLSLAGEWWVVGVRVKGGGLSNPRSPGARARRGGNGPVRHSRTKAASDSGGTTPISSRNFPPAGVGMSCGDVGAVTALMGCGGRASGAAGGNRLPLSSENIGAVSTVSLRPPRDGRGFTWSRLS